MISVSAGCHAVSLKCEVLMLNTSTLYKRLIKDSGRTFRAKILVTFPDSNTAELTDKNIMQGSLTIKQGTSDEGAFTVGSAIIGELDFEIDNSSGTYDNLSFENAVFDVRIGLVTEQKYDGTFTVEWLRKGIYTAEEVTVNEKYISIVAYDNIAKLDVPFADIGLRFPRTVAEIYSRICTYCGVPYAPGMFPDSGYLISTGNNIEDGASCREVLSYAAQLTRSFIFCDNTGTVHIRWYEDAVTGNEDGQDVIYEINERQKINGTVQITGVRLTTADGEKSLLGTDGYCLTIEDNPLALNSNFLNDDVWDGTGGLIGTELTPFSADVLSDPALEAGDIVRIYDIQGNSYLTPVTSIIYRLDGKMSVSCDAENAAENNRTTMSPFAKVIAKAKKQTAAQISEYDIRAKQFGQLAANAMGFYQTDEMQDDGSTITYLHDKPLLSDSQTIWKKSVDGFFVSTDGGQTYSAGMDSYGNAVLNMLAVKGIVADWIQAGTLSDQNGTTSVNMEDGTITIQLGSGNALKIWANGITMYDSNQQVLASMFVATSENGVLTANNILVGTRDSERTSIDVQNGKGRVITDMVSASKHLIGSTEITESYGKLHISNPVSADISLESGGQEVGSFFVNADGDSVLNSDFVSTDSVCVGTSTEITEQSGKCYINNPVVGSFSLEANNREVGSFYVNTQNESILKTDHLFLDGYFYAPTNITVNGVTYTVLAKI